MNKNTLRLNLNNRVGKGLTLLVLLLTISLGAKANPVDSRRAHLVASNFLNAYGVRSAELTDISAEAGFTNLYVFSTENGFVLLAADDCVQPILGYSFTEKFDLDDMPDNKRAWIQGYSEEIQAAIDSRSTATAEVAQLWRDLAEGNSTRQNRAVVVDALLQTRWNQDEPYNNLCPMIGTERTVTGCVATAMAQIMKYHGHPSRGNGSHSYTWNGQTLSADFQNTNYAWANMINSYAYWLPHTTQEQAVATLMYHCGVSVNMNYGLASGAFNSAIAPALKNYFNYSKNTSIVYRSNISNDNDWIAMLKSNLDNSHPVLYTGSGDGGGHAFVCDGYRDDDYFHFNWGWGGNCDDWYLVNNLNPGLGGIGSGDHGVYNDEQSVVVNIYPSPNNAIPTNLTYTLNGRNVTLNWNTAAGVASYNIYRNGSLVGNATTNSFTHTNAPYGEGSYYVRSIDSNGEQSLSSNVATVTIAYPTPVVNDLAATVSGRDVTLNWTVPEWCYPSTPTATMTYGGGTPDGAFGITGQSMYWGHRYLAANLNDYDDMHVYKVSFYAEETGDYRLHIYQGTNGTRPQTQVVQQDLTVFAPGWQEIDLNNTVQIDASQDLWVFMYDPLTRDYPASVCNSDYNVEGSYLSIYPNSPTGFVQANDGINFNIRTYISDGNYTYDLYRNGYSIANNLTATSYNDNNLADGTYNYTVKTQYYAGLTDASNTATVTVPGPMHEITATANPTEGGTVSGAGHYYEGRSCTLTATPATGYIFRNWTKDGLEVSTDATYTFTVTEAGTYVANFVDASTVCNVVFELRDRDGDGWNGNKLVVTANGASQELTIGSGYSATFNKQFATGDHVTLSWINGLYIGECSFTVSYEHTGVEILAKPQFSLNSFFSYEFDVDCAVYTYDITATANPTEGGTVSGAGSYEAGDTCTLTATPATDYIFRNWTKDGTVVSQSPTYSFMVTEHADYVANFVDDSMVCNVVFELRDSHGDGWNGDKLVVTANGFSRELTLDNGHSATFNIPFATGDLVTLSWVEGFSHYSEFYECSFTVSYEDDDRYIYDGAYLDGSFSYTFVVNCTPHSYTIAANVNPAEGGTVSGAGDYYEDQSCTLTASANSGYAFLYWTKNGTPVSNQASYTFLVTENATYVANFVDASTVCNVVFDLSSGWSFGWIGNQLVVTSNGLSQYLTIASGSTESFTIPFTKGTSVSLGWITGYFSGKYTFTVSYEGGEVFFESSGTLDSSFSHDFVVNCDDIEYSTLTVPGYETSNVGWRFIASPVVGSIEAMAVGNIFDATGSNLYRFDQSEVMEWRNYKSVPFKLENGKGYLYATKEEQTLAFVGPYNEADEQEVPLIYTTANPSASMHGWNLIGNPFTTNATIGGRSFYRMNSEGSEIIAADYLEQNIAPMEGIFVHADTEGETVTFAKATRATGNSGEIVLNLFSNGVASTSPATTLMDRAIVRMGEGRALPKFQFKDNSDKLYIPQSGKDYAVVTIGRDVARNVFTEMPVNFEAAKNGTYTLSVNVENMDLEYLHLIDNLTGADVDLLPLCKEGRGDSNTQPTYTFTAKTTDYTSRFKLVFSTNDASTGSASDAPFAYISNGEIRLLVETCQGASLQVIDMTGRVIRVCTDVARNISTSGIPAGIYILRLIDGDSVRMQKIVVP